jgi:hypothetical protein
MRGRAPVFLVSVALATTLLAAQLAPPVHWHRQEPPPHIGFRHIPIVVFGAAGASVADYAGLLQRLARDRWVLFLDPENDASAERAAVVIASLREAATARGFTSIDVIGDEQGQVLALKVADVDAKLIRRVLLLGAPDADSHAARSRARFKTLDRAGRTWDDAAADELLTEVTTLFDGCDCQKAVHE